MQQQEFRRLAAELKNNLARLMDKRSTWESHWQECADFMQPRKAEINKERQRLRERLWKANRKIDEQKFKIFLSINLKSPTFFLIVFGIYVLKHTPVDAIPDLSDVQVIIKTPYPGQAPQVVEDQVTYPLSTAMLAGIDL